MIPDTIMQGLLKTLIPIKIIKHDQPGKSPSKPYCTWQEISNPSNGWPQTSYDWDNSLENVDINKTETVQVEFYTKTTAQNKNKPVIGYKPAYQLAEEVLVKMQTYDAMAYQKKNNVSIIGWNDVTPLTQFMGDINELRATIELQINNNLNYSETTYEVDRGTIQVNLTTTGI